MGLELCKKMPWIWISLYIRIRFWMVSEHLRRRFQNPQLERGTPNMLLIFPKKRNRWKTDLLGYALKYVLDTVLDQLQWSRSFPLKRHKPGSWTGLHSCLRKEQKWWFSEQQNGGRMCLEIWQTTGSCTSHLRTFQDFRSLWCRSRMTNRKSSSIKAFVV